MNSGFRFRPYQPGDEKMLLDGFSAVFPGYRKMETWRWIYAESPDGAHIMLALTEQGDLAAHYACTVHTAICAGNTITIGHICDVFSLPAYRSSLRKGVFVQTYKAFLAAWAGSDKLQMLYGFPSQRPFRLGKLVMQYQTFSDWSYYRYTVPQLPLQHNPLGIIQSSERFGGEFDRLWHSREHQYTFAVCRTAKYLNWRFTDNPDKKYWVWTFSAFLSPDILGYVVLSANKAEIQLVDFCFPEELQLSRSFWFQVVDVLRWKGVKTITTWGSMTQTNKHLFQSVGFVQQQAETIIPVFRSFDADLKQSWVDKNFHFTMADSDLY